MTCDHDDRDHSLRLKLVGRAWRHLEHLSLAIHCQTKAIERLTKAMQRQHPPVRNVIHVVNVKLSEDPMPPVDHMPDFTLPSTSVSAGLSIVNPRKPDGSSVTSITWSSSDDATLPLEQVADTTIQIPDPNWIDPGDGSTAPLVDVPVYNVKALTPLKPDPGVFVSGVVTAEAAGMVNVDIKIVYGDPPLGHMAITAAVLPE